MEVITLSLSRNILRAESGDRARMRQYAAHLTGYRIIVLTRKRDHGYEHIIHEGNLHIYPTNSASRYTMLFDAFRIGYRLVRSSRDIPVISAQDPLEIGIVSFLIARIAGARFHLQVHGDYFSTDAWVGGSLVRKIRRMYALLLLRRARAIRVVSERIAQSLVARGILRERITVLPIRPELETFLAHPTPQRVNPPYTFLYIGRLAPEKDIPRIIEAFNRVHTEYAETTLRIVGTGSEEEYLRQRVEELGLTNAVSFLPWTDDASSVMRDADVFLLASRHEAYALTLLEAMAAGLPIVTTDVGCVGEIMRDGVHGIVVRTADIDSYARSMKTLITDTDFRLACGARGRSDATVVAAYTNDAYVHAWVSAIEQAEQRV